MPDVVRGLALPREHPPAHRLHQRARVDERRETVRDQGVDLRAEVVRQRELGAVGDVDGARQRRKQHDAVVPGVRDRVVLDERAVDVEAVARRPIQLRDDAGRSAARDVGDRVEAGLDPRRVTDHRAGHDRDQCLVRTVRAGLHQARVVGAAIRVPDEPLHRLQIARQLVRGELIGDHGQGVQQVVRDTDLVGVPVADLADVLVVLVGVQQLERGLDAIEDLRVTVEARARRAPVDRDRPQPRVHRRREVAARPKR